MGHPGLNKSQRTGLENCGDGDADAGMEEVKKKVFTIHIVNIAIVGIGPAHRPRLNQYECVAAVDEPWSPLDDRNAIDVKHVLAAVAGAEALFRNASGLSFPFIAFLLDDTVLFDALLFFFLPVLVFLRLVFLRSVFLHLLLGTFWFLFLMFRFLREGGNRDSQEQREDCCAAHS